MIVDVWQTSLVSRSPERCPGLWLFESVSSVPRGWREVPVRGEAAQYSYGVATAHGETCDPA